MALKPWLLRKIEQNEQELKYLNALLIMLTYFKLHFAIKLSNLIDIKSEFILFEDIIDGIIFNSAMFHNAQYADAIDHFSNMYNICKPNDINVFKDDFKKYIDNLIKIINQVEQIFNIFAPALQNYNYQQVI